MPETAGGFVLDTPEQIEAYRILATVMGLKIELRNVSMGWPATASPTRGLALRSAQRICQQYGIPGPVGTRRTAHRTLRAWCVQQGLLKED